MYNSINLFITKHHLINSGDIIIVGLSGGPDSVFLLQILAQIQKTIPITLIVAHLNHEWRHEADQEEQLCHEIANSYGLQYITSKISALTLPFTLRGSKEEYARKARRFFFEAIAKEHNANSIALGHHLQDQEETFFIRLIRGSSLTGLTAIKPRNGLYIRPLLEIHKNDILAWLDAHNITYAYDASNDSQQFLRNRIRSTVLPALRACDSRFEANFLRTLHRLSATELFLEKLTATTFEQLASKKNDAYTLSIPKLLHIDPILQHRIILHWLIKENVPFPITQAFLNEIIRFFNSPQSGSHNIHEKWMIIKKQASASLLKI